MYTFFKLYCIIYKNTIILLKWRKIMVNIMYILQFIYVLLLFIIIIKVLMNAANYIGERLRFGEFFMRLLHLRKEKK